MEKAKKSVAAFASAAGKAKAGKRASKSTADASSKQPTTSAYSLETLCVTAGWKPGNGDPLNLPIYQSTAYTFDDADAVGELFDLQKEGHMYTRISNPGLQALEERIAVLEGGVGCLVTATGQAATLLTVLTLAQAGDHVVTMSNLYGGTFTLLTSALKKMGIDCTLVPVNCEDAVLKKAIRKNTKLVFGETIGNPRVDVLDFERMANIAHAAGLPLVVDNTFASPYLCQPFQWGADIVVHSATKYLDGHSTSMGGAIVDSGKFDWAASGRFSSLTAEDPNYHGLSFTTAFGPKAFITKARAVGMRDLGPTMSPFNAFLIHMGSQTLALRMQRHSENALAVARFLEGHSNVEWVSYPLLESSSTYDLAKKYLPKGASGMIAFGPKGGAAGGKKVINALRLATLIVHMGDVRTHVLHPASMSHRQLSEQQQIAAGVTPNLIRLTVGIEDVQDIIADLDQALRAK